MVFPIPEGAHITIERNVISFTILPNKLYSLNKFECLTTLANVLGPIVSDKDLVLRTKVDYSLLETTIKLEVAL